MGRRAQLLWLVLSVIAAASMWFYVDCILVAHQRADAREHERPRGNLSDLYPRWLGARELLLHHRNPYGDDVTTEIQRGYYGRALDPSRPNDPKDHQGFAYPVYVVFLLAPLIGLPFKFVQSAFYWFLVLWTGVSVWLWLRSLRGSLTLTMFWVCVAFTLGSFPAVQGIKLQQLTLLVAGLLAASNAAIATGSLFLGGVLLALATIKPQLSWPLVAWLLAWTAGDWRNRRKFAFGFFLTMALLLAGSEIILPGWWKMFAGAIAQYHQYAQNQSVMEVILDQIFAASPGALSGRIGAEMVAAIAALICVLLLRRSRSGQCTPDIGRAAALILAFTVLVVPMFAPYNQVLLLPALLSIVRDKASSAPSTRGLNLLYGAALLALAWPWISSCILSLMFLLGFHDAALNRWQWPFFSTFAMPVLIFVLLAFQWNAAKVSHFSHAAPP